MLSSFTLAPTWFVYYLSILRLTSCCFNDYSLGHRYVFYASRVDPSSAYFSLNNCLAILILFILWVNLNYVDQVPKNSVGILLCLWVEWTSSRCWDFPSRNISCLSIYLDLLLQYSVEFHSYCITVLFIS